MNKNQIIKTIKENIELYENEAKLSAQKLGTFSIKTAEQIKGELSFYNDMTSRAYALKLLLEQIEEE